MSGLSAASAQGRQVSQFLTEYLFERPPFQSDAPRESFNVPFLNPVIVSQLLPKMPKRTS